VKVIRNRPPMKNQVVIIIHKVEIKKVNFTFATWMAITKVIANCLRKRTRCSKSKESKCHATTNDDNEDSYGATFATRAVVESGVSVAVKTVVLEENDILCDNQSSVNMIKDSNLLSNIRESKRKMRIAGIGV
jgi:hypothetical protein